MRHRVKIILALILPLVVVSLGVSLWTPEKPPEVSPHTGIPRAVIVDELSLTYGGAFAQQAQVILEEMGFQVDYIPGEEVTVEFFRNLPSGGYRVILLRTHSSGGYGLPTFLFTSEPYSNTKYLLEQFTDQLSKFERAGTSYFAVGPEFIRESMRGNLDGATVIAMGCNTLSTTRLADAFISRGASGFVGWDELVTASRTDSATLKLLRMLSGESTLSEGVSETVTLMGPDSTYNSVLRLRLRENDYTVDAQTSTLASVTPTSAVAIDAQMLLVLTAPAALLARRLIPRA